MKQRIFPAKSYFEIRAKRILITAGVLVALASALPPSAQSANHSDVEKLFREGKLADATEQAAAEVERGVWNRRWSELLIRCQLETGDYDQALETYQAAIKRYPSSLPLRALGIEVGQYNDLPDLIANEKAFIERYLQTGQLRYATSDTLVAAGRYFSKNGIDARIILKSFYDRVLESNPEDLEALVATAELAIDKGDFKVAADTVQKAKRLDINDARLEHLAALALASSDPAAATAALATALTLNPKHIPSLILKAEKEIDGEYYAEARTTIDSILEINPKHPLAFALLAVLAHVDGEYDEESEWRDKALEHWPVNPEVDHLIGRKLSDKYRFKEGAAYQRLALTFDPQHVGATFQLAQDLLRLGKEEIGWKLAEEVQTQDPYNVVAYNLMTLKDRIDGFKTISSREKYGDTGPGIFIRMDPTECDVYGDAVLKLLIEARDQLCEKYELVLIEPVIVEIFPKQSDFAIRTFGLPGGEGFLGVCFGHVITANSPASQGDRPSNWKSVLWHEFCHVITLTKTNNRMPRWLSEGISVYEEKLRDPRWGQSMTPRYREMILGDDFTPVSELSGAFLSPKSPTHLQFAYYESSLVVEYLVDAYGLESLNGVLASLATGIPIQTALATNVGSIERLEMGFKEFAHERAKSYGADLKFDRDEFPSDGSVEEKRQWAEDRPDNYWARIALAQDRLRQKKWKEAADDFEFLRKRGVATTDQSGVLESLAFCYRELNDTQRERQVIEEIVASASDPLPSLQRLVALFSEEQEWGRARDLASTALGIQPLSTALHQSIVTACEALGEEAESRDSLLALRALAPVDRAGVEYRLAKAYRAAGETESAKRHVIEALLIAPRYRDAHRLLLALTKPDDDPTDEDPSDPTDEDPSDPTDPTDPTDDDRSDPTDQSDDDPTDEELK